MLSSGMGLAPPPGPPEEKRGRQAVMEVSGLLLSLPFALTQKQPLISVLFVPGIDFPGFDRRNSYFEGLLKTSSAMSDCSSMDSVEVGSEVSGWVGEDGLRELPRGAVQQLQGASLCFQKAEKILKPSPRV